ncbi:hypothetical protein D3C80_1764930 [compost metagenome]
MLVICISANTPRANTSKATRPKPNAALGAILIFLTFIFRLLPKALHNDAAVPSSRRYRLAEKMR